MSQNKKNHKPQLHPNRVALEQTMTSCASASGHYTIIPTIIRLLVRGSFSLFSLPSGFELWLVSHSIRVLAARQQSVGT